MRQVAKFITIATFIVIYGPVILFGWYLFFATIILMAPLFFSTADLSLKPPKVVIHKALNYNNYNVVIISKRSLVGIFYDRKLYANIWVGGKKTNSYFIVNLDELSEYDMRIKEISILPNTQELKIEFTSFSEARSGTGIDLYQLPLLN